MGEEMQKRVSFRWFEERRGDGWSSKVKGKRGEGGKEGGRERGRSGSRAAVRFGGCLLLSNKKNHCRWESSSLFHPGIHTYTKAGE